MTADLRALLQEWLDTDVGGFAEIEQKTRAALAAPAPEPVVASELDTRDYWVVADTEVEYAVPDGYERETLKAGSKVWLARWTEDQLEAARRSADELHRKLHAAPPPASPDDVRNAARTEYCWLVENGKSAGAGLAYLTMGQVGSEWTEDPWKALHFSRRIDAERFSAECEDAWRIVQHGFDAAIEREGGANG